MIFYFFLLSDVDVGIQAGVATCVWSLRDGPVRVGLIGTTRLHAHHVVGQYAVFSVVYAANRAQREN